MFVVALLSVAGVLAVIDPAGPGLVSQAPRELDATREAARPNAEQHAAATGLMYSEQRDRSGQRSLDGAVLRGDVYIFVAVHNVPEPSAVDFVLDGKDWGTESDPPWDLQGGARVAANALDLSTLETGEHHVEARIHPTGERLRASFIVDGQRELATRQVKGRFFTAGELRRWRSRASNGPYRLEGDVAAHSPGDWNRIAGNARRFLQDPLQGVWSGPGGRGCVPQGAEEPPREAGMRLRDAAFYGLVRQDPQVRGAVRERLLAQATALDFSDQERWCPGIINDVGPGFVIAHWATQHLLAYDFVREEFSAGEQRVLDDWFVSAAQFHSHDLQSAQSAIFDIVSEDEYAVTDDVAARPWTDAVAYRGAPEMSRTATFFNNRRAAQMRFVAMVGAMQGVEEYRQQARQFVQDYLKYAVFPQGYTADFARWTPDNEELGWLYAVNLFGHMATIADALHRVGDDTLVHYVTSDGLYGSQGGEKSLKFVLESLLDYSSGDVERYATSNGDDGQSRDRLIDGRRDGDALGFEAILLPGSTLWGLEDRVMQSLTRNGFPPQPLTNGPNLVWQGEGGIYAGVLLMYGPNNY